MKLSKILKKALCLGAGILIFQVNAITMPLLKFAVGVSGGSAASSSASSSSSGNSGSSGSSGGESSSSASGSTSSDSGSDGGGESAGATGDAFSDTVLDTTGGTAASNESQAESLSSAIASIGAAISGLFSGIQSALSSLGSMFSSSKSSSANSPGYLNFSHIPNLFNKDGIFNVALFANPFGNDSSTGSASAIQGALPSNVTEEAKAPSLAGDPVFISSGKFFINDYDASFKWGINDFILFRNLLSGNHSCGSFGNQWFCSLDTRIIRGTSTKGIEKIKEELAENERELNRLSSSIHTLPMEYRSDLLTKYANAESRIKAARNKIQQMEKNAAKNKELNKHSSWGYEEQANQMNANSIMFIDDNGNIYILDLNTSSNTYENCDKASAKEVYASPTSDGGLEIHYLSGMVKKFSTYGLPEYYKDRYGSTITFSLDGSQKVKSIQHKEKDILSFTRNEKNYLTKVTNELTGQESTFYYEENNLVKVLDSDNDIIQYEYDQDGDIKKCIKADGTFNEIFYGNNSINKDEKKVIAVINEEGWKETFDGDFSKGKLVYTDPDGNTVTYFFEDGNHITKEIYSDGTFKKRTYNSKNQITSLENNYGLKKFYYDSYGNLTKASYSDGSSEKWTYQQPYNLLASYCDRDSILTSFEYDSTGFLTSVKRDGKTILSYEGNGWGGVAKSHGFDEEIFDYDAESYTLTNDKSGRYEYDLQGRIASYTNAQGKLWTWSYDGRTTTIRTPNNIEQKTTRNNRKDIVCKSEKDLLSGKTKVLLISYGKSHNILEIKSGIGNDIKTATENARLKSSYEYTPSGKLKTSYLWNYSAAAKNDAPCIKTEYEYNASGDIVKEKRSFADENKKTTGKVYCQEFEYSYEDGNKIVTTKKDGILFAREFYDENGNLVKKTDAEGRSTSYKFSAAGKISEFTNPYGGVTKYLHDPASGQISSIIQDKIHIYDFCYGEDGRLKSRTKANGFTTDFSYQEEDGIKTVTESTKTYTQKTEYDSLGRKTLSLRCQLSDGKTVKEQIEYDDKTGSVTCTSGNFSSKLKYDAWGNLLSDDESGKSYSYDEDGNCIAEESEGSKKYYLYNAFGKVSQIKDGTNEENFFYDAKGNILKQTDILGNLLECTYDSFDRCTSKKERGMPQKEFAYDGSGLIVKTFEAGDLIQQKAYSRDLRTLTTKDALGNSRTYNFDQFGRLIGETNALGKSRKISYKAKDSSVTTSDFNGNTSTQTYSEEDGIQVTKYGDKSYSALHYDAFGSVTKAETEISVQTYSYDEANMLISSSNADKTTSYSYDKFGRVKKISLDGHDSFYDYDSSGNLKSLVSNLNKMDFCYDKEGKESKSSSSNGITVVKEKDKIGREILTVQKDSSGKILFAEGIIYDDEGRIACTINSSSSFTLFEYDKHGRLQKQLAPYSKEIEEKAYNEFEEYGEKASSRPAYDSVSLPKEFMEKAKDLCSKMNLDFNFAPQKSWIETYKYDLNGNRVSKSNALGKLNYEYDAENRLVRIFGKDFSGAEFKYDDNGNLISENTLYKKVSLLYTPSNRLRESRVVDYRTESSFTESFTYDAFGRRQSTCDNTGCTVRSVYDGLTMNELCEYEPFAYSTGNTTGTDNADEKRQVRFADIESYSQKNRTRGSKQTRCSLTRYFTYANGRKVFQDNSFGTKYSYSQSASYELTSDGRGSTRCVIAADGSSSYSIDYDADGTPYFASNTNGVKKNVDARTAVVSGADFAYAGKQYDASLGLYDYGFRNYAPAFARFTTSDPIRDGMNWYAYCAGDPVNFVDLWGLEAVATKFNQRDIGSWVHIPGQENLSPQASAKKHERFGASACAATTVLNIVSDQYTKMTGKPMTKEQAVAAMNNAIAEGAVDETNALTDFHTAANAMWATTGLKGSFTYTTDNPQHTVYCLGSDNIYSGKHFVNDVGNNEYYDVYSKNIGNLNAPGVQILGIRGYDFSKNN